MLNSSSYFSLNGQLITDNLPLNLLNDRGLAYGHGLFESILLNDSSLGLIDRHLARLCEGAKILSLPIDSELVLKFINLFIDQLHAESVTDGVVKIIVTAGEGGRGYQSPTAIKPTIICSYSNLPAGLSDFRSQPLSVRYCQHRLSDHQALAGIKHLNRLDQIMARSEWDCERYQEGLMFNASGQLIEATSANVFVKNRAGDWLTPDLKKAGIKGVMRAVMIEEIFPACNIPISIADVDGVHLEQCQVLLLGNSIRGLSSVGSLYDDQNQLVKSLPIDQQTLMLYQKLTELYPQYK
ncbi:MAG: aminodeoxychorismate lyase [Porticoccaceae bacterium]